MKRSLCLPLNLLNKCANVLSGFLDNSNSKLEDCTCLSMGSVMVHEINDRAAGRVDGKARDEVRPVVVFRDAFGYQANIGSFYDLSLRRDNRYIYMAGE